MGLTKNMKRIGMAAHNERLEVQRYIESAQREFARRREEADCQRERELMESAKARFGDAFVDWYDSPAVPDHGYARDRIAMIEAWIAAQSLSKPSGEPKKKSASPIDTKENRTPDIKSKVLDVLKAWDGKYPPSLREIGLRVGRSPQVVRTYLLSLQADGLIDYTPKIARSASLKKGGDMTHAVYTDGDDMIDINGNVVHLVQVSPDPKPTNADAKEGSDNRVILTPEAEKFSTVAVWDDDDPDVTTCVKK